MSKIGVCGVSSCALFWRFFFISVFSHFYFIIFLILFTFIQLVFTLSYIDYFIF